MAFLGFLFIFLAAFFFYLAITNLIAVITFYTAGYFGHRVKTQKYQGFFSKGLAVALTFTLGCVFVWLIQITNAFA